MNRNIKIKDALLSVYDFTTHYHNVNDIEQGFKDYNQFDLIYHLLNNIHLGIGGYDNIKVYLIHSDGGCQHYQIHYRIGSFTILIANWKLFDRDIFKDLDHFCSWLQYKIDCIIDNTKVQENLIINHK